MSYQLPAVLNSLLKQPVEPFAGGSPSPRTEVTPTWSESDTALCYSRDIWRCRSAKLPPRSRDAPCKRPFNPMRGEACARELANRQSGDRFSSSQPTIELARPAPMLSALQSAIALTRWYSIVRRRLADLRIALRIVGQLALTGYRTTHAAEWPPASRSVRWTGAHRSTNEPSPICTVAGFFATRWLSTTGINEMPTRHSSCPGAARLLDRAFQGAIVSHGRPNVALGG